MRKMIITVLMLLAIMGMVVGCSKTEEADKGVLVFNGQSQEIVVEYIYM